MARMTTPRDADVPGSIYLKRGRWYWNVRLPGEVKHKPRALIPHGGEQATTDLTVAQDIARDWWGRAMMEANQSTSLQGDDRTVAGLVPQYQEYARGYYVDADGQPTTEVASIEQALRFLTDHCPGKKPMDFNQLDLQAVRERMVRAGNCRSTVNKRVDIIRRMFRWAASQMKVPTGVYTALLTVSGLRRNERVGHGEVAVRVAESKVNTEAVDPKWVHETTVGMTPTQEAMVLLHLLTGMRSTEVCVMRPVDIDQSDPTAWLYYPERHKNAYRGHTRQVALGPKAQEILRPFIQRCLECRGKEGYVFNAVESYREALAMRHAARKTKEGYGNGPGTNCTGARLKSIGERFTEDTYREMVTRAIKRANRGIEAAYLEQVKKKTVGELDAVQGVELESRRVPHWHPHQLRHTAATTIRDEVGRDEARASLGHKFLKMTDRYTELDEKLAKEAARQIG
jgi:integrase